jgi:hypothetical protein
MPYRVRVCMRARAPARVLIIWGPLSMLQISRLPYYTHETNTNNNIKIQQFSVTASTFMYFISWSWYSNISIARSQPDILRYHARVRLNSAQFFRSLLSKMKKKKEKKKEKIFLTLHRHFILYIIIFLVFLQYLLPIGWSSWKPRTRFLSTSHHNYVIKRTENTVKTVSVNKIVSEERTKQVSQKWSWYLIQFIPVVSFITLFVLVLENQWRWKTSSFVFL